MNIILNESVKDHFNNIGIVPWAISQSWATDTPTVLKPCSISKDTTTIIAHVS